MLNKSLEKFLHLKIEFSFAKQWNSVHIKQVQPSSDGMRALEDREIVQNTAANTNGLTHSSVHYAVLSIMSYRPLKQAMQKNTFLIL